MALLSDSEPSSLHMMSDAPDVQGGDWLASKPIVRRYGRARAPEEETLSPALVGMHTFVMDTKMSSGSNGIIKESSNAEEDSEASDSDDEPQDIGAKLWDEIRQIESRKMEEQKTETPATGSNRHVETPVVPPVPAKIVPAHEDGSTGMISRMKSRFDTQERAEISSSLSSLSTDGFQAKQASLSYSLEDVRVSTEAQDLAAAMFPEGSERSDSQVTPKTPLRDTMMLMSDTIEAEDSARLLRRATMTKMAEAKRMKDSSSPLNQNADPLTTEGQGRDKGPSKEWTSSIEDDAGRESLSTFATSESKSDLQAEIRDIFESAAHPVVPKGLSKKEAAEYAALSRDHEREMAETKRTRRVELSRGDKRLPMKDFLRSFEPNLLGRGTSSVADVPEYPLRHISQSPVRVMHTIPATPMFEVHPARAAVLPQSSSIEGDEDLPDADDLTREIRIKKKREELAALKIVASASQRNAATLKPDSQDEGDVDDLILVKDSQHQPQHSEEVQVIPSLSTSQKKRPSAKAILGANAHSPEVSTKRRSRRLDPHEKLQSDLQASMIKQNLESAQRLALAKSSAKRPYDSRGIVERQRDEEREALHRRQLTDMEEGQATEDSQDSIDGDEDGDDPDFVVEEGSFHDDNEYEKGSERGSQSGSESEDQRDEDECAPNEGSSTQETSHGEPDETIESYDQKGADAESSFADDESQANMRKVKRSKAVIVDDEEDQDKDREKVTRTSSTLPQDSLLAGGGFTQFFRETQLGEPFNGVPADVREQELVDESPSGDLFADTTNGGFSQFFKPTQAISNQDTESGAFHALLAAQDSDLTIQEKYDETQMQPLPASFLDDEHTRNRSLEDSCEKNDSLQTRPRLYMNDEGFYTQNPPTYSDMDSNSMKTPARAFVLQHQTTVSVDPPRKLIRLALEEEDDLPHLAEPGIDPAEPRQPKVLNAFDVLRASKEPKKNAAATAEYIEKEAEESDEEQIYAYEHGSGSEDEGEDEDDQDAPDLEGVIDDQEEDAVSSAERARLREEKYQEHKVADDQMNEKVHRDAIEGKTRLRRRQEGALDFDDPEDQIEEAIRREEEKMRRQKKRKRKLEGDDPDALDELIKNPDNAAFVNTYHDKEENDVQEESYLDKDQPIRLIGLEDEAENSSSSQSLAPSRVKPIETGMTAGEALQRYAQFKRAVQKGNIRSIVEDHDENQDPEKDDEDELEITGRPVTEPVVIPTYDADEDEMLLKPKLRGSWLKPSRQSRLVNSLEPESKMGRLRSHDNATARSSITSWMKPLADKSAKRTRVK